MKRFKLKGPVFDRVDLVDKPANQFAEILLAKRADTDVAKRTFTAEQRRNLAAKHEALPGGGFPIANEKDLKNAIRAIGRAKDRAAAMAHIKRRASALGLTNLLPDNWGTVSKSQPDINSIHTMTADKRKKMMKALLKMTRTKKSAVEPATKDTDEPLNELFDLFAKAMVDADVFVDDATGEHVRDMLTPEVVTKMTELMSAESAVEDSPKEEDMADQDFGDLELPDEVVEYISELESAVAELAEAATATPVAKSEVDTADEDDETKIMKALSSLPDDVAKILKADREAANAAKAEADAAIEKAAVQEYIAKAATYAGVVEDADTFGPMLRKIATLDEEAGKAVEAILEEATAKLAKSKLFDEVGTKAEGAGSDALAKATTIAKGYMEAGEETSLEAARARVWIDNPDLYAEYEAERRAERL